MANYEQRLAAMGLVLPQPLKLPSNMVLPFPWVNVRGNRAFVSGHGPQNTDGTPAGPFGAVGENISIEEAKASARKVAFSMARRHRACPVKELPRSLSMAPHSRPSGVINSAGSTTNSSPSTSR